MNKNYFQSIFSCFLFISFTFISSISFAQTAGEYIEAGQLHFKNKTYYDALKNFNRAFMTDSNNIESLVWRGQTKMKLGLYEESLQDFELGIVIRPNESRFYSEKGMVLMYQGQYEQALNSFVLANNIETKSFHFLMIAEMQWHLKKSYQHKKYNHAQIVKNYANASKMKPKWFLPYRRMGEILYDSLQNTVCDEIELTKQISKYYQKATDLDDEIGKELLNNFYKNKKINETIRIMINKGNYYGLNQNFDKAMEMYDKVIDNGETQEKYYYQTLFQKAKLLAKKNQYQEAIITYSAVLKIIPAQEKKDVANAFYMRSLCFNVLENYENALTDLNQAFAFGFDNGFMYAERGNIKLKLNQKEEACKDWNEATKKGWKEAEKNIKVNCLK